MYLDEFHPGAAYTSDPRVVTEEDLELFTRLSGDDNPIHRSSEPVGDDSPFDAPVLQGTFGLALLTGFIQRMELADQTLALLDTQWHYDKPMYVGDTIHCRIVITRVRTSSTPGRGVIDRYVELINQDGAIVQHGTSAALVRSRSEDSPPVESAFGTVAWGQAVAEMLMVDPEFTQSVAAYDGTIGLAIGGDEIHLRIYRGAVIEVSRRSLRGADFVANISGQVWCELMFSDTNDFMKKAMMGKVKSTGNGAEYLRMTRVLIQLVDAARALLGKDSRA